MVAHATECRVAGATHRITAMLLTFHQATFSLHSYGFSFLFPVDPMTVMVLARLPATTVGCTGIPGPLNKSSECSSAG